MGKNGPATDCEPSGFVLRGGLYQPLPGIPKERMQKLVDDVLAHLKANPPERMYFEVGPVVATRKVKVSWEFPLGRN